MEEPATPEVWGGTLDPNPKNPLIPPNFLERLTDDIDVNNAWMKDAASKLWGGRAVESHAGGTDYPPFDTVTKVLGPADKTRPSGRIVRQEYKALRRNIMWQMAKRDLDKLSAVKAVIVWGQPGLGKSDFLYYVLAKSLEESFPVIFCNQYENAYFFNDGKVYSFVVKDLVAEDLPWNILALVDPNDQEVLGAFNHQNSQAFVVLATSPQTSRWKGVAKYLQAPVHVMPPWTREEILQASSLGTFPLETGLPTPVQLFDLLGPCARTCFGERLEKSLNMDALTRSLTRLAESVVENPDALKLALYSMSVSDNEQGRRFHTFFFAFPDGEEPEDFPIANHKIPTEFLCGIVRRALYKSEIHFLKILGPMPAVAGLVFEALMARSMTSNSPITISVSFNGRLLFQLPCDLAHHDLPFDAVPDLLLKPNTLYVPTAGFPSIDAFFFSVNANDRKKVFVTLLQATIGQKHTISHVGIRTVLALFPAAKYPTVACRFVFVVQSEAVGEELAQAAGGMIKVHLRSRLEIPVGWAVLASSSDNQAPLVPRGDAETSISSAKRTRTPAEPDTPARGTRSGGKRKRAAAKNAKAASGDEHDGLDDDEVKPKKKRAPAKKGAEKKAPAKKRSTKAKQDELGSEGEDFSKEIDEVEAEASDESSSKKRKRPASKASTSSKKTKPAAPRSKAKKSKEIVEDDDDE